MQAIGCSRKMWMLILLARVRPSKRVKEPVGCLSPTITVRSVWVSLYFEHSRYDSSRIDWLDTYTFGDDSLFRRLTYLFLSLINEWLVVPVTVVSKFVLFNIFILSTVKYAWRRKHLQSSRMFIIITSLHHRFISTTAMTVHCGSIIYLARVQGLEGRLDDKV